MPETTSMKREKSELYSKPIEPLWPMPITTSNQRKFDTSSLVRTEESDIFSMRGGREPLRSSNMRISDPQGPEEPSSPSPSPREIEDELDNSEAFETLFSTG